MVCAAELAPKLLHAVSHLPARPLALQGCTGSGKTTLLRGVALQSARQAVWRTAFDLAGELAGAVREGSYEAYSEVFVEDNRPLCVEHLEDLRGRPRTQKELRILFERAATRRPILLTLTRTSGDAEILAWLRPWAEVLSLD